MDLIASLINDSANGATNERVRDGEWWSRPVEQVPLAGLVYTTDHDWFPLIALSYALAGTDHAPVHLWRHDGRLHVADGRHRIVGDVLAGRSSTPGRIRDGCDPGCPCSKMIKP